MTRAIDKVKHCHTMQDVRREVNALDDVLVPCWWKRGLHDPGRPHQQRPALVRDEARIQAIVDRVRSSGPLAEAATPM